jgi:predicted ATPase/class 3 adenylate cyclase
MSDLPTGTVTFLFTDIEGSTRLWEQHPEAMRAALARHDALLRAAIEARGGHVFKTMGDAFCSAFSAAPDAVDAVLAIQQSLRSLQPSAVTAGDRPLHPLRGYPVGAPASTLPLLVRVALHTGAAEVRDRDYFGPALSRVARLLTVAHGGQVLLSAATRELVQDDLPPGASLRDLGSHRLRDLQRAEHVFQLLHADLPADFPPLTSLETLPNNLPLQLSSFVGREKEMAQVRRLLETTRLLTLTGTGGTGKTRLALQVAAELLDGESDGVWLVELAALADPALVLQAVATVLGVREEPGRPLTLTLVDVLKPKRLLFLLDNCEHLLQACATLAEVLLRGCPGVQILATSREGLNIAGETTYRLPSLSLPDLRAPLPTAERLMEYEAARLFIDRATAALPAFTLTDASAPAVAQVCHRLDGIPLAIELAAARVKVLSVERIAERLDDSFRLLAGGSRTALPRHQTLRALIDWSYDLLSEAERTLLRRLSVFAGGWTLEAAEAVCADDERPTTNDERQGRDENVTVGRWSLVVGRYEVLDLLMQLVEKSLVVYEERGEEDRYRLLETIRQYSRDRLLGAGEAEVVHRRHRDFFLRLAEEAEPKLHGPEQAGWLERLEREHDNVRAALEWCQAESATYAEGVGSGREAGLRLAGALWWFWLVRGYFTEGRDRLARALSRVDTASPTAARANALNGAGNLAVWQADYAAGRSLHEESLAIRRALGDRPSIARSLNNLGLVAWRQGDYSAARALYEEALAVTRELGERGGEALVLNNLGLIATDQADYAAALSLFRESLAIQRELGDKLNIAIALNNLGNATQHQGDYETARALYKASLEIRRELGNKHGIVYSLERFACLAATQGQAARSARLFGAGESLREAIGARMDAADRADYEPHVAAARAALGDEAFAVAWAEGRAMTLEAAIEYALEAPDA